MGVNNFINPLGRIQMILSEQKHIFWGSNSVISFGIWLRTADPHLVYNINSKERINPSRSIFIGDHVWLSQDVTILKGTKIGSGSIVGAGSVLAGKTIPSNTSWAGNPARQLKEGVCWSGQCVHLWQEKETSAYQKLQNDEYIFENIQEEKYDFDLIDMELSKCENAERKMKYLCQLESYVAKNRFFM